MIPYYSRRESWRCKDLKSTSLGVETRKTTDFCSGAVASLGQAVSGASVITAAGGATILGMAGGGPVTFRSARGARRSLTLGRLSKPKIKIISVYGTAPGTRVRSPYNICGKYKLY
jgi:hypothetical protein